MFRKESESEMFSDQRKRAITDRIFFLKNFMEGTIHLHQTTVLSILAELILLRGFNRRIE